MGEGFVDFRAIKQAVSIEQVLVRYGIELRRANQTSLRGKCPLPTHRSETSRDSFSVAVDRNIWACQSASCAATRQGKKGGNILDFVAVMESCSIRDAALKIGEWFVGPASTAAGQGTEQLDKLVTGKSDSAEEAIGNKPLRFTLRSIDPTHPYLSSRGISEETARHFGIGFFPGRGSMSGRLVIPIANDRGELVAYAGRAVDDSEPKYRFPSGFKKSEVLWNLDRVLTTPKGEEPVIVVEGFFDTMKIHQAGLPRVVSLMGSSLSVVQATLVCQFARVALCLDGDEAGRQATQAIAAQLLPKTFVKTVHLADGVQPDQLSSEEIRAVLPKF